jgi:hypothetical protein
MDDEAERTWRYSQRFECSLSNTSCQHYPKSYKPDFKLASINLSKSPSRTACVYVLDDSRIKDLRTGVENRNTQAVLDGDLDKFLEASLKSGL